MNEIISAAWIVIAAVLGTGEDVEHIRVNDYASHIGMCDTLPVEDRPECEINAHETWIEVDETP